MRFLAPLLVLSVTIGSPLFAQELDGFGKDAVEKGDPSARDDFGYSILHAAIRHGNEAAVQRLLERGADVNYLFCQDRPRSLKTCATPLLLFTAEMHHATNAHQLLELFLKNGADINQESRGTTPLIEAAGGGHLPMLEALIKKGALIDTIDSLGRTALTQALERNQNPAVKLLIEKGADPNLSGLGEPSPLDIAQGTNNAEAEAWLRAKGAKAKVNEPHLSASLSDPFRAECPSFKPKNEERLNTVQGQSVGFTTDGKRFAFFSRYGSRADLGSKISLHNLVTDAVDESLTLSDGESFSQELKTHRTLRAQLVKWKIDPTKLTLRSFPLERNGTTFRASIDKSSIILSNTEGKSKKVTSLVASQKIDPKLDAIRGYVDTPDENRIVIVATTLRYTLESEWECDLRFYGAQLKTGFK